MKNLNRNYLSFESNSIDLFYEVFHNISFIVRQLVYLSINSTPYIFFCCFSNSLVAFQQNHLLNIMISSKGIRSSRETHTYIYTRLSQLHLLLSLTFEPLPKEKPAKGPLAKAKHWTLETKASARWRCNYGSKDIQTMKIGFLIVLSRIFPSCKGKLLSLF